MKLGNEYSSGMFLDSDSLAFPYSKFYKLIYHFSPNPKTALLIGGGAYSVPKYFQAHDPDLQMDVLEIDPALTQIAEEEFHFRQDGKKVPIHEDGRIFLNQNKKKYDAILGDAYQSLFSIPFHLVSEEAIRGMHTALNDNGVLIINILCQVKGENRDLLHSMVKTCRNIFPYVRAFKPRTDLDAGRVQNIMILCMKNSKPALPAGISDETSRMLQQEIDLSDIGTSEGIVLRDDFAPVEHYAEKLLDTYYRK
jgi:spermidine synthase